MGQILITYKQVLTKYKSKSSEKKIPSQHKYWFPVSASETLAGIVADLICDGHLQGESWWRFDYTSKSKKETHRFENELYFLFGVKGKDRPCKTNKFGTTFNYGVNCRLLARLLHLAGVPAGNKVLNEFLVPKWIMNNKKFFRRFAQRVFTCEGSVWDGSSYGISLEFWKSSNLMDNSREFLGQIKGGLDKYFHIQTTNIFTRNTSNKRKDGNITKPVRFNIKRKDSLIKFYKEVGFEDNIRQKKLKNIIKRWGSTVGT